MFGANLFYREIERIGCERTLLSKKQRGVVLQQWREVFAAPYYQVSGKWKLDGFEWHVFSFNHTPAITGDEAINSYKTSVRTRFFVVPEDPRLEAYSCESGEWPSFRQTLCDIYVWPQNLSWTVAFTHEESLGLGPYFSRREWIDTNSPQDRRRSSK